MQGPQNLLLSQGQFFNPGASGPVDGIGNCRGYGNQSSLPKALRPIGTFSMRDGSNH